MKKSFILFFMMAFVWSSLSFAQNMSYEEKVAYDNNTEVDQAGMTGNIIELPASGDKAVLLTESFDAAIPGDWTQTIYSGTGTWAWYAGGWAGADSDANSSDVFDVGLFTPAIDFTGEIMGAITLWHNLQDYAGDGAGAINVYSGGTDAANLEAQLFYTSSDMTVGGETQSFGFDPSSFADPSKVYFEFWYSTEGGTWAWYYRIDDIVVEAIQPRVEVTPSVLDLGEWPIGGWQEYEYLAVENTGAGTAALNASELDDPDGAFALMNPSIPFSLPADGTQAMVGVAFDSETANDGLYEATYVASWGAGKSVTTADVMATAYTAPVGDIVENPFMVALPYMAAGESSAFPMRSNYNIPGTATNGKDVVYMFTLAEDKELNVTISNATETPKMAIYAAGFEGEGGPMVSNAVATAGATATNVPLFAGDYYLVVSAESDDAAMTFDLDISATTMPDPECVMNPMPADGEIEVPSNGIVLEWTFGQYNQQYQVSYGTQYPPTDFTSDWMPAGDAGTQGTFALPNLDPSMQYFWMVNVMNNNATVLDCDVYGFTTTITPPSNLTASVVENAEDDYDVQLSWTSSAKSLLGYNVYRSDDGATYNMINASLVTTNSYLDEDLAYNTNPCYEYYVVAVFDEGLSDESNYASACITGVGTLNGEVTALLTGNPLIGAVIDVVSETGGRTYQFTTGGVGEYSGEVLEDCYTLTASQDGYITEVRTGVCVDYNTTVTEDFQLDEFPYPVSDVVAEELDASTVQVDWGNNGGPGEETVFRYDDGVATGQLGSSAGTTNTLLGNVHRVDAELSQMSWYLTGEGGPHNTISIYVLGLDADGIPDGNNVLFTESVSNVDDSWNTFTFDAPIDATGGFFLGVGYNGFAAIGTDDGVDDPYTFVPNTHYFVGDYTAGGWDVWETFGFELNGMIRAMGVPNGKASYAVTTPLNTKATDLELISSTPVLTGGPNWKVDSQKGAKDLMGYNVWRGPCYSDDPADFEFLGYTLDDQFTDNNWGDVDWGVYKWAVEAVYTNNVSEMAFSNCLDKDMEAVVGVEVTTNSGDLPEGCEIMFMNTSEPDMMLTYEIELDATGMGSIEPFRKGIYDYMVVLPGFGEISATDVLVDSDTTFVWQLEELLAPPSDLYVTPTGLATWTGGGALPFEPVFTDFEDGLPEGWTTTTNSSVGWFFTTNGSSSWWTIPGGDGQYACSNDDAANDDGSVDYLITSLQDFSNNPEPFLTFSSFYSGAYGQTAHVEVSVDGGAWEEVLNVGSSASWTEVQVDLAAYAGESDVLIAFHANDNGGWASGWAVDNVAITEGAGKYSTKGFQFFKIWHDGVFSNDVDTNFYQYGTNTEVDILVPGETYLAEVASLYSTGLSAKSEYEWTYLPCDSFPSWTIYEAYNIDDSDDNLVAWSDNVFFTPIEEDFEAGLPEGWSTATNSSVGWFFTTDGSSSWWPVPAGDGQYACSNDDAANDDGSMDYLITPEMSFVGLSSVSLSFSSFYDGAYGQTASVEVSMDGGATWTVVEDIAAADAWTNVQVDLSAYVGSESIWVAFHSNDNGGWASGWAVDNVSIAPSKAGKADAMVIGTNVYRDGEMIAFVPEPDTFYLDMDLMPGYYDYCVTKVYSADEGVHTWTSCEMATCVEDVLVPEDCYAPENLTAEDLLGDGYTATLNWEFGGADVQEFLYDDGVSTGQLGSSAGTTNTLLGNVHTVDAELTEMSWYLTSEGGPHNTISIYVLGLDGSGIPDGNNVLFTQSVSNTDDTWNTFTFDSPIDAAGGFFLGVGYNGFAAIGTDDGVGAPYEFVPNTHFFVGDYTAGGWETWETYGFNVNGMIRAMGVPGGKASYAVSTETTEPTGDLEYVASAPVLTGTPNWTAEPASKEFVGFNVYRDGELVASDITETTYADEVGVAGEFCYEVTAVYSVCGESDPSNEACVYVAVGVNDVDNNISVYPNPAKDFVMVEASTDIRSIEITNYMGQVVSAVKSVEMTQHRINTSDLSSGVYFVEVETAAGIETIRIVISE